MVKEAIEKTQQEQSIGSETEVKAAKPVTANELLKSEIRDTFDGQIADSSILIFGANDSSEPHYLAYVQCPIYGRVFNQLLFCTAPNPRFGIDTHDVIVDWTMPDRNGEYYENLQSQHARHLGAEWGQFMRSRKAFLDAFQTDGQDQSQYLFPVIAWTRRQKNDQPTVISEIKKSRTSNGLQTLWKTADMVDMAGMVKPDSSHRSRLNLIAGLLAIAYFDPDVRQNWPKNVRLGSSRDQFMGPAQVPVLVLKHKKDIESSRFFDLAERHFDETAI